MKRILQGVIVFVTLAVSPAVGQTEAEVKGLVQRAEAQIIELLQKGYHAELPKATAVGLTDSIGQQLSAAEYVLQDESAFNRYKAVKTKPFTYVYAEAEKFVLNREELEQLLKPEQEKARLQSGAALMIRELARASGELIICRQMQDINVYWGTESNRNGKQQHLYDEEGRVNPVAIYGTYTEHLVRKQIPGGHTPQNLHAFVRSLAAEDSSYTEFAADVTENYPEDDEALLRMLGAEASWSAMWAKGKECITLAEAKEERKAKRQAARLNGYIKKMANSNLPEEQKQYLYNKYSFRQLNALANGKVEFDIPEDVLETQKTEAQKKEEERLDSSARRICRMYATFFQLLGEEEVWAMEGTPDKRLEQLVYDAYLELTRSFVEDFVELETMLDNIHNTAEADTAVPAIIHKALEMDQHARLLMALGYDAMFEKILHEDKLTPQLFTTSDWSDILKIYAITLQKREQTAIRHRENLYYHSEKFAALMSGRVIRGGVGLNTELWSDSMRVLGSLSLMMLILTPGGAAPL